MEIGVDEVDVNDLVECLVSSGIFLSFFGLSFFQEVRQICFLSVLYLEIMIDHGVPQPVQGFHLSGTQRGFGGEVSVECEPRSLEVLIEVVHPPGSGGRFQEESCVVFLVLFQRSRGVRDDLNLAQVVPLGQGGTETPGGVLVWQVGVCDQEVVPIVSWEGQCRLL